MKKINILFILIAFTSLFWFGCKPDELAKKSAGVGVDSTQLVITVTKGADDFHYVVTSSTPVPGITNWNYGNKKVSSLNSDTVYYPLPGTYTITLTYNANGGAAIKHFNVVTTKTDYKALNDPLFTFLSGGIDNIDGKDWQIDALAVGHMSMWADTSNKANWWTANPNDKLVAGVIYDDILNFKLQGLVATYINHGSSYGNGSYIGDKGFTKTEPNPAGDFTFYFDPAPGTWWIDKRKNGNWLVFTPTTTPIFPMYYVAAKNDEYRILSIDENHISLESTAGGVGNNIGWGVKLIKKGWVDPRVTGTLTNAASGTGNNQTISVVLANPNTSLFTVISAKVSFGDGKDTTITAGLAGSAPSFTVDHRYMLKGTYTPEATISTSKGAVALKGTPVDYALNDPSYVPPAQNFDATTVYNDFDGEQIVNMLFTSAGGTDGTNATGAIVANPDKSKGPNRSSNVYQFMKTGSAYGNNYMDLPNKGRFDFTLQSTFTYLIYGTAGNTITFKLQNTDYSDAYNYATADQVYTIKSSNIWELVTVSFKGVGAASSLPGVKDITTDPITMKGYYNEMVWLIQPNNTGGPFTYFIDRVTGPVVAQMKK